MNKQDKINRLTLDDKVSLLSGVSHWSTRAIEHAEISALIFADGPHGLRKQADKSDHLGVNESLPATCFPTAATIANSWDKQAIYEMGVCLGKEAYANQVHVLLGPGLNIKRNPLCGRNFEYFSEDPYISGVLSSAYVQGVQSQGVAACLKHFALNSQETLRMSIDEVVDKRALYEIYLAGFHYAIQHAKPMVIMTSYNKMNGVYTNESKYLLQDILRQEMKYDGLIVSDWGGNNDRIQSLQVGGHLEMPSTGGTTNQEVKEAVMNGFLDIKYADDAIEHILAVIDATKQTHTVHVDYDEHHQKAVEMASKSIVLLKNDEQILPIDKTKSIAVIGDFANNPRYQGAGSSYVNPTKLDTVLSVLESTPLQIIGYEQGFHRYGKASNKLINKATRLAKQADIVLLFLGLDETKEGEGMDRNSLSLASNQLQLVDAIHAVHQNIVVVLAAGGVLELPFIDKIKGLLHTYLPGQGGAQAIVDIITGQVNPSGKLTETYPFNYGDVPSASYYPGKEAAAYHKESIFIGYRYYDTLNKPVLYPFGYGLSYTKFEYKNIVLNKMQVTFNLSNIGERDGAEIAQLYVSKPKSNIFRATKELKHFTKVHLQAKETTSVTFELTLDDFTFYDVDTKSWEVEAGTYVIFVGSSSQDLPLHVSIDMVGRTFQSKQTQLPNYYKGTINQVRDEEFALLYDKPLPPLLWNRSKPLTLLDTITQASYKSWKGKLLYRSVMILHRHYLRSNNPQRASNTYFYLNMRFQQIPRLTNNDIPLSRVKRWLYHINK